MRSEARLAGVAGLLFVVGSAIAGFFYPQPPDIGQPGAAWLSWAGAHRGAIHAGVVVTLLATPLFLAVVAHVRGELDGSPVLARTFSTAGSVVAVFLAFGAVPLAFLSVMDTGASDAGTLAVARFLALSTSVLFALLNAFVALWLGVVVLAAVQGRLTRPAWYTAGAAVVVACSLWSAGLCATVSTYHGPLQLAVAWVTFLGLLVVVAADSVWALRAAGHAAAPAREPAAAVS